MTEARDAVTDLLVNELRFPVLRCRKQSRISFAAALQSTRDAHRRTDERDYVSGRLRLMGRHSSRNSPFQKAIFHLHVALVSCDDAHPLFDEVRRELHSRLLSAHGERGIAIH